MYGNITRNSPSFTFLDNENKFSYVMSGNSMLTTVEISSLYFKLIITFCVIHIVFPMLYLCIVLSCIVLYYFEIQIKTLLLGVFLTTSHYNDIRDNWCGKMCRRD